MDKYKKPLWMRVDYEYIFMILGFAFIIENGALAIWLWLQYLTKF